MYPMMHCARGEMEMEMEGASGVESGAKNMSYKCNVAVWNLGQAPS